MRYLVEPTPVTELKEGDIIYSPDNTFRVKRRSPESSRSRNDMRPSGLRPGDFVSLSGCDYKLIS